MSNPTTFRRDLRLDFVLSGLSSCLALYSVGMGIAHIEIGLIFMGITVLGTLVAYFTRNLVSRTFLADYSGAIYAIAATVIFFSMSQLNAVLPEGGFPRQLIMACLMCWIIAIGSFTLWSDGVMLFQAVPAVSLFGMVGLWDTFAGATLIFFIFLLCVVILLARAHFRSMLTQAEASGFVAINRIHKGPWRQMAGPQWGLGAATVVVIISVICAPLIQRSVASVAGSVQIALPQSLINRRNGAPAAGTPVDGTSTPVGTGPHKPGTTIVLRAEIDRPRYLRESVYDSFDGHRWNRSRVNLFEGDRVWQVNDVVYRKTFAQKLITKPIRTKFAIIPEAGNFERIPVPGEVTKVFYSQLNTQRGRRSLNPPRYEGETLYANPQVRIASAYRTLDETAFSRLVEQTTTLRVRQLALKVTEPWNTDYKKAMAIKAYIESIATYNLSAAAVPNGADAVDYFLFESREGYCDLFASAMVTMARAVGIPARYVTGYYPVNNEKDSGGLTVLRASEKHAWAELLFKGVGWVPFDATEGAQEKEGSERGTSGDQLPWYLRNWFKQATTALISIIGLTFVAVLFFGRSRLRPVLTRRTSPIQDSKEMRLQVGKLYAGFARELSRASGVKRGPDMSPSEYSLATRPAVGELGQDSAELTELYVAAFFAPAALTKEDVEDLRTRTLAFKCRLRKLRTEHQGNPVIGAIKRGTAHGVGFIKVLLGLRAEDRKDRKLT